MPTKLDAQRLRAVARRHRASRVLLAIGKKGKSVQFFELRRGSPEWQKVSDLESEFVSSPAAMIARVVADLAGISSELLVVREQSPRVGPRERQRPWH
jgi:hypothetical protein